MQRIVKQLSDAVGLAGAMEIMRRWGGRELYVARSIEAGEPLALTLGLDLARKLVEAFGGQRLQLPAERNALLDLRNASIVRDVTPIAEGGKGISHEAAGLRYGLTRQGVSKVMKAHRDAQEVAAIRAERESRQSAAR